MNKSLIILLALLLLSASATGQQEKQKEPGPAAVRADGLEAEISRLIKNLGSVNWRTREEATRRLTEIGEPAMNALTAAHITNDIEAKERIERLLDRFHWLPPENRGRIEEIIKKYSSDPERKPVIDIEKLLKELSSENAKRHEGAIQALIEAGRPALPALKRLADSSDNKSKELAKKITNEILSAAGQREMKIVDLLRQTKYSRFYLLKQLSEASIQPGRQKKIAALLSGLLGLKSPSVKMIGGEIVINGFSFPRPPGGIVVSKSNGRVIVNGVEICVPGMIIEDITPAEVLGRTVANRSLETGIRECALKVFAERKEKEAVGQLINTMKKEKAPMQSLIVNALSHVVEGGPQAQETQDIKKSVQDWQKWWSQQNTSRELISPKKKNRRGRKNRQHKGENK